MVTDKDKGYKKFLAEMLKASGATPYVKVGVLEGEGDKTYTEDNSLTTVQVATFHEFGTEGGVPERSFLRSTHDEKMREIAKKQDEILVDTFIKFKHSLATGLGLLGEWFKAEVQKKIRSNIPPALKESTIRNKGSSVALIDTGQMVQSISYKVEDAE